jgi:hypothetical protein
MKRLLRDLERMHPGLKRSLRGALGRIDLASFPIPSREGARAGDPLPLLGGGRGGGALATVGGDGDRD